MKRIYILVTSIVLPYLAGLIGSLATGPALDNWYLKLNKPPFNPPNWIFAPVWTTLYLLMGIALYLVWSKTSLRNMNIRLFLVHLVLNSGWSLAFFGMQDPLLALFIIIPLDIMIGIMIWNFKKIDRRAAWLLWPYLAWACFATILNFSIWYLN